MQSGDHFRMSPSLQEISGSWNCNQGSPRMTGLDGERMMKNVIVSWWNNPIHRRSLMADQALPYSLVIDGGDFQWWRAGNEGDMELLNQVMVDKIHGGTRVNYCCA